MWLKEDKLHIAQLPPEWGGIVPTQVFLDEGRRLAAGAEERGIPLRLMGGVAIRAHSLDYLDLARRLGRLAAGQQEFTDLDFMSYGRYREAVRSLFEALGYYKRRATLSSAASERQIYFHPRGWFFVDVFYDRLLVANHPLDLRGRLELDSPTITPTDLLLEKLQIVSFSEKDLKDTLLLLAAHDLAPDERPDTINVRYLTRVLSHSWGFWYTVRANLAGLRTAVEQMTALAEEERATLLRRLADLLGELERAPKSWRWKARALIGPSMRWYEPVETAETVGDFGIWKLYEQHQSGSVQADTGRE